MNEDETRYYSDSEIELLIEDLTLAAIEAIELAAAEAARAAFLQSLGRETLLLQAEALAIREASRQQAEVFRLQNEAENLRKIGIKNSILAGIFSFIGGLAVGITATVLIIR